MELPQNYNWLSDDEWGKIKWRTKRHFEEIVQSLRVGHAPDELDGVVGALMFVVEQTWDIVRGKDKPLKTPPFFNRYDADKYFADD